MKTNQLRANIAHYRERIGMTEKTLETALAVSRQTFYRKKKNGGFTVKELDLMARIMHCKAEDLLKGV